MTKEEAITKLHWLKSELIKGTDFNEPLDMAIEALSAEAYRPSGEWIDIDNYYRLATCSHCHKVTMFEKWGEHIKQYDYCPNCGAIMKGGDDE